MPWIFAGLLAQLLDPDGLLFPGCWNVSHITDRAIKPGVEENGLPQQVPLKTSSETVLELCADRKYPGETPGTTTVLHTWGQNLQFHPNIHIIVTGGGLTRDRKWRNSKKYFFLPVRVLSAKFRGKFLALLKAQVPFLDPLDQSLPDRCYRQKWVVYCKPPFGSAEKVTSYLGRYTYRAACSNAAGYCPARKNFWQRFQSLFLL